MTKAEISSIAAYCDFNQMKKNDMVNMGWWKEIGIADKSEADFIRKGNSKDSKSMVVYHVTPDSSNDTSLEVYTSLH